MIKVCMFLLLKCISYASLLAGNEPNHQYRFFTVQYHYQYIWPHRPDLKEHAGNPAKALEMHLGWRSSGSQLWHRLYNFPSYGIGFYYNHLGNPEVLGEVRSGFVFMEFYPPKERLIRWQLRVSLGLANFNTYYHPENNPENRFIGTPWNVHFNLNYALSIPIGEQVRITPGLAFTHFSNGAYQKPNRGINIFDVNMGIRYRFGKGDPGEFWANDPFSEGKTISEQTFFAVFSVGLMQREMDDPTYVARTLTLNHTIRKKLRTRWGVGIDIFYDDHAKEQMRLLNEETSPMDYTRVGGFVSCDIIFNRMALILNRGIYVYYGYEPQGNQYSRIGMRYITKSGLTGHMALKAHAGRADYIEWGIGYAFGDR